MTRTFLGGLVELDNLDWTVKDPSAPTFICRDCGATCDTQPINAEAICPTCCAKSEDGHDYVYERDISGWNCKHCGDPAPPDYGEPYDD